MKTPDSLDVIMTSVKTLDRIVKELNTLRESMQDDRVEETTQNIFDVVLMFADYVDIQLQQ